MLDQGWKRLELNVVRQCAGQASLQHRGKCRHGLVPVERSDVLKDRLPWVKRYSPSRETVSEHRSHSSGPTLRASIFSRHLRSSQSPATSRGPETHRQMQAGIQLIRQTEECDRKLYAPSNIVRFLHPD